MFSNAKVEARATYSTCAAPATLAKVPAVTTIGAFFETARRHQGRRAWKHGSREWTWDEAARDVRRVARSLIALGVKLRNLMRARRPGSGVGELAPSASR